MFSVRDVPLPLAGRELALRVYVPFDPKGARMPGFLYVHGGGWQRGCIESHDCICRRLARVCVCVCSCVCVLPCPLSVCMCAIVVGVQYAGTIAYVCGGRSHVRRCCYVLGRGRALLQTPARASRALWGHVLGTFGRNTSLCDSPPSGIS